MRRREFITLLGGATAVWPLAARAQRAKVPRIGFLGSSSASAWASRIESLRLGLRDTGYIEGQNIFIESRWAEGRYERHDALIAELLGLGINILLTHGTPGTVAAQKATKTTPILMVHSGDAVAAQLVVSLARPGGNITGTAFFVPELMAKRLELLKEAAPRIIQVAVILNPDNELQVLKGMEVTAGSLNVKLHPFNLRGPDEFTGAFSAMALRGIDGVVVLEDAMLVGNRATIAELAEKTKLVSAGFPEFAQAGGLIGYGANYFAMYRRAGYFVDKILKGAKPADIPVEQPTKFDFVLNLKTAKALGLDVATSALLRADEVIE